MRRSDAVSDREFAKRTEHLSLIGFILPDDCRDGDDVAGGKENDASSIRSSVLLFTTAAGKYEDSHSVPYAIVILIEDTDVGIYMRRVLLLLLLLCDIVAQGTTTYLPGT